MDTSGPAIIDVVSASAEVTAAAKAKRQHRSLELRRKMVEETLMPGTSVARVAQSHRVNANQLFHWRNLYLKGRLGGEPAIKLLPVTLPAPANNSQPAEPGAIHIKLAQAQIRIEGKADVMLLRTVLELLRS